MSENKIYKLTQLLKSDYSSVRCVATTIFGKLGPIAIPALTVLLKHKDRDTRFSAAYSFCNIDKLGVSVVIGAMKDTNYPPTWDPGRNGIDFELIIPTLICALQDDDLDVRCEAARALSRIGPGCVPALVETLKNQDSRVRGRAARTLSRIGTQAKNAEPALAEALSDEDLDVRNDTFEALCEIKADEPERLKLFIKAINNKDFNLYYIEACALGKIGVKAVPLLIEALEKSTGRYRAWVARVIGNIGPQAKDAVLSLVAASMDENKMVQAEAAEALGKIGPEAKKAIPALITALKNDSKWVRLDAARALGRIGPDARDAVPILINTLKDTNISVRKRAAWALGNIGTAAVPSLVETFNDEKIKPLAACALLLFGKYKMA